MNLNQLDYRVSFFKRVKDGPEAGSEKLQQVYACFAGLYEPTQKDVQLGNLGTDKVSVTLNIRNAQSQYMPTVREVFELKNGLYKGLFFNIKNVAPAKTSGYIKVVGEQQ